MQNLLEQLESAQMECAKTDDKLQQALVERDSHYEKFKGADVELKKQRKEMVRPMKPHESVGLLTVSKDSNSFVSVLVDGDCTNVSFITSNEPGQCL